MMQVLTQPSNASGRPARGKKAQSLRSRLSPEKQKFADKVHEWAYTDPKKNPEKYRKLFEEIWLQRLK